MNECRDGNWKNTFFGDSYTCIKRSIATNKQMNERTNRNKTIWAVQFSSVQWLFIQIGFLTFCWIYIYERQKCSLWESIFHRDNGNFECKKNLFFSFPPPNCWFITVQNNKMLNSYSDSNSDSHETDWLNCVVMVGVHVVLMRKRTFNAFISNSNPILHWQC